MVGLLGVGHLITSVLSMENIRENDHLRGTSGLRVWTRDEKVKW